jgi:hypothetical protein
LTHQPDFATIEVHALPFREFCAALGASQGDDLVVILRGYFDDAGKLSDPESPSLVIAGFVAPVSSWEALILRWEPIAAKHSLSYFSGKECEHGTGEFDRKKNQRWSVPQNRWNVRSEFASAIIETGLAGFVAGVVAADYRVLEASERKTIGKPFSFVAQTLMVIIRRWADENHVHDRFPYLFEAGSEGYGEFSSVFNKVMKHEIRRNTYRMESCAQVGKDCVGAQAADLLASEFAHCMNSIAKDNDAGFRRQNVNELRRRLKIEAQYHNAKTIAEVLAQPKSEYRPFKP